MQKGFTSSNNHTLYSATLYSTEVVRFEKSKDLIKFNCGGWHTRATIKAITTALTELGLHLRMNARIRNKQIQIEMHGYDDTKEIYSLDQPITIDLNEVRP